MARRKGVAPIVLYAVGGILALIVGFVALSSFFGQLQGFIQFLFDNSLNIILLVAGVGVVLIAYQNSKQDDPKWKRDIGGLVGLLVFIFIFFTFVPVASGAITGYSAELTVNVFNPAPGEPQISGASVDNFERTGPLTALDAPTFSLFDDVTVSYEVFCGGKQVDSGAIQINSILESSSKQGTATIKHLPAGEHCNVQLAVPGDEASTSFTVPG